MNDAPLQEDVEARLIAAAPEMLAALRCVVTEATRYRRMEDLATDIQALLLHCRSIIDKVEGR